MRQSLALLTVLASLVPFSSPANILFLLPIATKSHRNVFDPLIDELARRDHSVTVISPVKSSKVPAVRELVPSPLHEVMGSMKDAFLLRQEGSLSLISSLNITHMEGTCRKMYEMPEIQSLMAKEKYDLVIVNGVMNHCNFGLVHHLRAPFVLLTTLPAPSSVAAVMGHMLPTSFVPEPFLPFSHEMSFKERLFNFLLSCAIPLMGKFMYYPRIEKMYQEYVPDAPGIKEMDGTTSMIFMNSHFSLTYPRPLLPSIVEVGGMHCRPGQPLPKEMDDFLSGAEHGFILFSFGSIVKPQNLPESTTKVFLNVFRRLKQRVIWKWDEGHIPDLPSNVMINKWLPQQDILAHKNIRLFITHGGLLSTQEAVYHGVPLIGFPFFGDQDLNMGQAEKGGYSLTLEILDVTEEKLESAINQVLHKPIFKENVQRLSSVYRDQPETPLQRAVFWAEYVIRHKGAKLMESAAKKLNFLQYYQIDVGLFLASIVLLTLWIVKLIVQTVISSVMKLFRGKRKDKKKKMH